MITKNSAVSSAEKLVLPIQETQLNAWFERDRAHVALLDARNDATIVEWLDDEVFQAIEDGFLDSRALILGRLTRRRILHESAYEFAMNIGLLPESEEAN
jgi:hypothetical protein